MGNIHLLAVAIPFFGDDRAQYTVGEHDAGCLIGNSNLVGNVIVRPRPPQGAGTGFAGQRESGFVRIGAFRSIAGSRAIYNFRVVFFQIVVADTKTLGDTFTEILNKYVGFLHQFI